MTKRLRDLVSDDAGQDLIEYALLASVIGFATVAAVNLLGTAMSTTYDSWNDTTQDLWEVPDPKP